MTVVLLLLALLMLLAVLLLLLLLLATLLLTVLLLRAGIESNRAALKTAGWLDTMVVVGRDELPDRFSYARYPSSTMSSNA